MPTLLRNLSVVLALALCAASAVKQQPSPSGAQPAASGAAASPAQPSDGPECERQRQKLAAMPPCANIESPEKRDACEVNAIDTRHKMHQMGCHP